MGHMKEAALWYVQNGYKVFPCSGKVPLTKNGVKDASKDETQIETWWTTHPEANIGLATGDGLVVVDIDDLSLNPWHKELSATVPFSITPRGGRHYFFSTDLPLGNTVNTDQKVDTRGNGGYVIAPPSVGYSWGSEPPHNQNLPKVSVQLLETIRPKKTSVTELKDSDTGLVPVGGRNNYLTKLAASFHNKGMSSEAILAALLIENEEHLASPLPESEVRNIVQSISRYVPNNLLTLSTSLVENEGGLLIRASDITGDAVAYLKDKDKVKGQPTGIEGLDRLLGGGKRLGELTVTHAHAKTGKNSLWHVLMYYWLEQGIPIAYASREIGAADEVMPNLLSIAFEENAWQAEMNEKRIAKYTQKVKEWPLYFTSGYGALSREAIIKWVSEAYEQGVRHFFFDHLHYLLEDPEDHHAASKLIKELKALAKTLQISIDLIVQPNKLMDGQRLGLNSIKGGAAIGQALDNLITLERVPDSKNIMKLTLEVARSKLARPGTIYLQYDPETTRFGETEPEEKEEKTEQRAVFNPALPKGIVIRSPIA